MRVLFLSNFYPPASRGGYELWCQEVALGLRARGHEVVVLTSRHEWNTLERPDPAWVKRELHLEMELASLRNGIQFFTRRAARETESCLRLQREVQEFAPDAILIWGMWNLPRALAARAEELLPGRVAYYMGDYWPTLPSQYVNYWQAPARNWVTAAPKLILGTLARHSLAHENRPHLHMAHVLFPTAFMEAEFVCRQVAMGERTVIYGAADTAPFAAVGLEPRGHTEDALGLLYVGRLTAEKGVHTTIEALGSLVHKHGFHMVRLVIVGAGEPAYVASLHQRVEALGLDAKVTFLGAKAKEALPDIYRQAEILLFPSLWPEPFGRVMVEAMAAGLVVVGTAVGGTAEILVEGENALIFPPGDADALADRIMQLAASPALRHQLAANGRELAIHRFDIARMTAEIEHYLLILKDAG